MPPMAATGRPPKYCSSDCRYRAKRDAPPRALAVVSEAPEAPEAPGSPAEAVPGKPALTAVRDGTERDYLARQRDRLDQAMDGCPPDRIAPLAKEYRETLRAIAALDSGGGEEASTDERPDGTGQQRRAFNATSV